MAISYEFVACMLKEHGIECFDGVNRRPGYDWPVKNIKVELSKRSREFFPTGHVSVVVVGNVHYVVQNYEEIILVLEHASISAGMTIPTAIWEQFRGDLQVSTLSDFGPKSEVA